MASHTRNSASWDRVGEVEDCMAMLAGLEILRAQIEHKSLYAKDFITYDEIYDLSIKMIPELRNIKLQLARVHTIITEIARNERN